MRSKLAGATTSFVGSINFDFVLQTGTVLHDKDDTFMFLMGNVSRDGEPDLIAIKKSRPGSNSTEVHIMAGVYLE